MRGSVSAGTGRQWAAERLVERLRTRVAKEIVAGEDVVDLQAFSTHEALADVALQEGVVADELLSLLVSEKGFARRSPARLTTRWGGHVAPGTHPGSLRAYHSPSPLPAWL
jgi:hypothetical protein